MLVGDAAPIRGRGLHSVHAPPMAPVNSSGSDDLTSKSVPRSLYVETLQIGLQSTAVKARPGLLPPVRDL